MDNTSGKLHPVMTVTALAVAAAALAIAAVISGVIPERGNAAARPGGAAAATFSTTLAAKPFIESRATTLCGDCATVVSIQPAAAGPGQWQVEVRMADGGHRLFAAESQPSWYAGEQVRISNGIIMSM